MGYPNPGARTNLPGQYLHFLEPSQHHANPDALKNPFAPEEPAAPPQPIEVDPSTGAPVGAGVGGPGLSEFVRAVASAGRAMLPPTGYTGPAQREPIVLPATELNGSPPAPARVTVLPSAPMRASPQVSTGDAPPVAEDPEAQRRALMAVQPQGSTDPMQDPAFRAYVARQAQDVAELRAAQGQAAETRGSVGMKVGNALLTFGGAGPEALSQRYAQAGQPVTDVLERQKVARGATEDVSAEQKLQGDIRQNALAEQANNPASSLSMARAMLALHQGLITRDQLPSYTAAMDDALHKGVESQSRLITARAAESQAAQNWEKAVDEQTGETYLVNKRTGARQPLAGSPASPAAGPSGPAASGGAAGGQFEFVPPGESPPPNLGVSPMPKGSPGNPGGIAPASASGSPDARALAAEAYRRTKLPGEVRKQLDDADATVDALRRGEQAVGKYPGAFGLRNNLEELIPGAGGSGIVSALTKPVTTAIQAIQQARRSPEETQARAAIFSEAYRVIHDLAGSQVTPLEKSRIEQFTPAATDDAVTIRAKIRGALQIAEQNRARVRGQYLPQLSAQPGPVTFNAQPDTQGNARASVAAPSPGKSKLQQTLETNPVALGSYAPLLTRAAKQGQQSFDASVYALSQTDPAFNDLSRKLSEAKQ